MTVLLVVRYHYAKWNFEWYDESIFTNVMKEEEWAKPFFIMEFDYV